MSDDLMSGKGFDIDDVATGIADKLVRRHPQVFGDAEHPPEDELDALWLRAKAEEKGRSSVTDGVPLALPALSAAAKLRHRAEKGGVAEPPADAMATAVAHTAIAALGDDPAAIGHLLLAIMVVADDRDWDAEGLGRAAVRNYRDRLVARETDPDGD